MTEVYSTQPLVHRSGITAIDATDPADASPGVNTKGYKECRFDITISGVDFTSLEVQALFWNPRQSEWWGGGKRTFTSTGQHALVIDCRGAIIFLKVTVFSGTSFSLAADYILS